MKINIAKIVTDKIIEQLKTGVAPWQQNYSIPFPENYITKKQYQGVNSLLLMHEAKSNGYKSHQWATFNQIRNIKGAKLKKGSKGAPIVFYKIFTPKDQRELPENEQQHIPLMRYSRVFNMSCVEGVKLETIEVKETPKGQVNHEAQKIVKEFTDKPKINHVLTIPNYTPSLDEVNIPNVGNFKTQDDYYHTLFHEMAHSTGHNTRLNRPLKPKNMDVGSYAEEELIAELTSMFLSTKAGLHVKIENSASYCEGWLKALKNNRSMIIKASSKAQKAYNYILKIKK